MWGVLSQWFIALTLPIHFGHLILNLAILSIFTVLVVPVGADHWMCQTPDDQVKNSLSINSMWPWKITWYWCHPSRKSPTLLLRPCTVTKTISQLKRSIIPDHCPLILQDQIIVWLAVAGSSFLQQRQASFNQSSLLQEHLPWSLRCRWCQSYLLLRCQSCFYNDKDVLSQYC